MHSSGLPVTEAKHCSKAKRIIRRYLSSAFHATFSFLQTQIKEIDKTY